MAISITNNLIPPFSHEGREHYVIEQQARRELTRLLFKAVQSNLEPDKATAVLLSGGVGSSLIMEIAHRLHPNVTAFIIGSPGSPDYAAAVKLCERQKYNYRVIPPQTMDIIETSAKSLGRFGIKTILTGDGSNELFGGETDCVAWIDRNINERCAKSLKRAHRIHANNQKNMKERAGIQLKAPFLEKGVSDYALMLDGELKIRRNNRSVITKYILRKVAADFLPDYIVKRYSLPFPYGTGFGFDELKLSKEMAIHTLPEKHLLIAQFDKLPLYFPLYYAAKMGLFKKRKLTVDFVSTGGDDNTYIALLTGGAHIGVADPIFSYAQYGGIKSEIIGEFIGRMPVKAVTLKPDVHISSLSDLNQHKIGTFQQFATTHTLASYLLPGVNLKSYDYTDLEEALSRQEVDVVITIPEFAEEIISRGGKLVYDFKKEFPHYLFTGFFVSEAVQEKSRESFDAFLASIKEAVKNINNRPQEALEIFKEEFPGLTRPKESFASLSGLWSKDLKVKARGLNKAKQVWHTVYPWLIKSQVPSFVKKGLEDKIAALLTSQDFSRYQAYREDEMRRKIKRAIENKEQIKLVGYFEISGKSKIDKNYKAYIKNLVNLTESVKKLHPPGLQIEVILADEHQSISALDKKESLIYLEQVEKDLFLADITPMWLRSLWRRWRIRRDIIQRWQQRFTEDDPKWWDKLSIRSLLEKEQVKEESKDDSIRAAHLYYVMRTLENKRILRDFKNYIFFTHLPDTYQKMLPDMATLYLKSS